MNVNIALCKKEGRRKEGREEMETVHFPSSSHLLLSPCLTSILRLRRRCLHHPPLLLLLLLFLLLSLRPPSRPCCLPLLLLRSQLGLLLLQFFELLQQHALVLLSQKGTRLVHLHLV